MTDAPASPAAPAPPATVSPLPLPLPRHIMVLDDEAPIGEALRSWLTPYCARIHITQRLEQALAIVRTPGLPIDALVVDFRLADAVDGIEATRLLRQAAGQQIPALLFTGDTDPERVRMAYRSGLQVLFKPVQPEQMMQALAGLVANDGQPADSLPASPADAVPLPADHAHTAPAH